MITEKTTDKNQIDAMLEAGVHFGYDRSRCHPTAKPYVFGKSGNVDIFDLEKTSQKLEEVKKFVEKIGSEGKQILFVGGKREAQRIIRDGAEKIDMPYVAGRWIGGTLTNFVEIRKRVLHYLSLLSQKEKGELAKYTKKERLMIDREIDKLEEKFAGISNMESRPAAMFIIDADREEIARDEAIQEKVPVISLSGSDNDFSKVQYPVPGNDSSVKSISFFIDQVVESYKTGLSKKA